MKIAFIYDAVYPYKIGGVEKRIWEISRRLATNGHEVHVFGMKLWDGPSHILHEGVHLHGVCRNLPFHTGKTGRRSIFPVLWFSISLLVPLFRKGRFDLIDCQNFPYFPCIAAWAVSSLQRTPLVITWNEVWGVYWFEYIGRMGVIGKFIEKCVTRLTPYHAAISYTTVAQLRHLGLKCPITITPCGVDLNAIRCIAPSSERSDIISIGRLIKDKHIDILVEAVRVLHPLIPGIQCVIIGRGPEEERLRDQVSKSGLNKNVRFIGFTQNYDEIVRYMKASRVCVLPSTREGFGIVALEALACGTPVVTADHPGNAIKDLSEIGPVRVVPLNARAFADAILVDLSDSNRREAVLDGVWDWNSVAGRWFEMAEVLTRSPATLMEWRSL